MNTVAQALAAAEKSLFKAKISSARLDAELLFSNILSRDRSWLLAHNEEVLSATQQKRFELAVQRRIAHEPIAYIIGRKEFFGLDFVVNKSVLIPRVETEVMVEQIISHAQNNPKGKITILDIGTGCGAIAVALAKNLPQTKLTASDVSAAALRVAKQNSQAQKIDPQIDFVRTSLFAAIPGSFDIIAANLPYVPLKIKSRLEPDLNFEPQVALYGGEDGLNHYRHFFASVLDHLKKDGQVWCEADPWQHKTLTELAAKANLRPIFEDYLIIGFGNTG